MPPELTYPSLRCIVEYLEPNKRLHIASRSTVLRQGNKSIPIHIANLSFNDDRIEINHITYRLTMRDELINQDDPRYASLPEDEKLAPGDIPLGFPMDKWWYHFVEMKFGNQQSRRSVLKPCNMKYTVACRRMTNVLLDYQKVFVDDLSFDRFTSTTVLRLPRVFQVCVRKLAVETLFDRLSPIIHSSSFPLKKLEIRSVNDEMMSHQAVRTAETLDVSGLNTNFPLEELTNKHVISINVFHREQVMRLITSWVKDSRDIGSSFTIDFHLTAPYERHVFLEEVKKEFGGETKNVMVPCEDGYQGAAHCVSIPTNYSSELNIYALSGTFKIKMEVMALSTATAFQPLERQFPVLGYPPSSMHPVPKRNYAKIRCAFGTFLVVLFSALAVLVALLVKHIREMI